MKKLRAVIAEDLPASRAHLRNILENEGVQIVAEFWSGSDFRKFLIHHSGDVDVIFSDLQMPGITGPEALANIPHMPPVVIVTAFLKQHAYSVIKLNYYAVLEKPIFQEDIHRIVESIRNTNRNSKIKVTMERTRDGRPFSEIISACEIDHLEREGNVIWAFVHGTMYRGPWNSLIQAMERLEGFVQTGRDTAIRVEAVESYELSGDVMMINLSGSRAVRVSRRRVAIVRAALGSKKELS